jgi:hypothetical protein
VIPGKSLQDDYLRVAWDRGAPYATEKKRLNPAHVEKQGANQHS